MAYQDDFRNKVIAALKKKNLAIDLSDEQAQEAIIQETQIVAQSESQAISPEEMRSIIQDVARQVKLESDQGTFKSQSNDFTAFDTMLEGPLTETEGSYSGGGIAVSVANKDIVIIPANGGLGAAGSATSVNSISQIDFKYIANPNAYATFDPREVKASLFNWGERVVGNTYDTPVLGIGGAWNGVSYAPTPQWGVGNSFGSGVGGSINQVSGFGQIIFFKPASSTIYAALYNDVAISSNFDNKYVTIIGYNSAVPGSFPTAGFAVSFGGIGGSGPLAISGAASNAQSNQIKFLSPLTISNSTAANTLTLGLSSATSTVQNFVGGGAAQYVLSSTTSSFAAGDLFYASGTGHVTLTRLNLGANNTYLSSNGSAPFWTSSIAANTVSVNAATGATILYPLLNNVAGSGSAVSTDVDFNVDPGNNILRYASGSFYVGTAVSAPTFTGSGNISIKPGANSTTAIQLDNFAGQPILNVDSSNGRVSIGNNVSAPNYTLDVAGDINASTGFTYRIAGSKVLDAISLGTGVVSSSLTSVGTISTGVWAATAITTLYGGIGNLTPFAVGDLLYANTTTTVAKLADVATGSVLASGGVGVAPSYVATSTLSVGFAITSANQYVIANTGNADNYVTFTPAISSGTTGVGLSISNAASQLTYNPSLQILKVPIVSGTAVTVTSLTGTIITATQPNITSAANLATVGTITSGIWQGTAVGTTYGGTGSNLGNNTANANKLVVLGTAANGYAATLVDGANSGYLLMANANTSAPSFVNSTNAAFTFASGTLTINNAALTTGTITGVPTNGNDIVNKTYADSISAGLDIHDSARITTLSAIGGSYRQSGTAGTLSGLNDYIIATTPGALIGSEAGWDTVGIALTNGQRVLVKDGVLGGYASGSGAYGAYPTTYGGFASSWVANGVYTVASYGGAATSGWLLIRAEDSDNGAGLQELTGGTFLFVEEGTNYADHAFVCSNDTQSRGPIGFGSTQIAWTLFAGANTLIAGQGLVESGNNLGLLVNLVEANGVSTGLSRGFTLGGTRAASLGSSTYANFTVTGANNVASSNTFTANSDGWQLVGGQTNRTLTVTGSNITLTGGGNTLTLSSSSTLNLNSQTLSITNATSNITFTPSSTTATTHNLVSNATAQYQLSTQDATFALGDLYYNSGSSFAAMTRLALGTGAGTSVLVRNGASGPVWGRINLATTDMVTGTLPVTNGGTGAASFTANGILYGNTTSAIQVTGQAANSVLVTNGSNVPSLSTDLPTAVTIGSAYIYRVGGNDVAIADGGTNTNATPTSGAVAYGTGTAYAFTNAGTAGSVLISNGTTPLFSAVNLASSNAVTGVLPIANGGSNATSANFTTNGVVIYDGTRLTSATGLTMIGGTGLSVTGTVQSTGGFFIGSNSVITSFAGLYGAITISNSASVGGTSFLSTSGQSLVLNYPGTGITGGGSATQVAYYNAAREITGSANYTYSPTAATGVGLSVNAGTTTGTILYVNNTNGSATSGNLIDVDQNGTQRFSIDYKGMASIATGAGNTALVVTGGRTLLASATTNYATLGLTATGTDPSAPNVGDLWYNGTNLYFRKTGGTNFDLLVGSVSGSGTANKLAKWSSSSALTDSNISDAGTGMTITSTSAVGAGGGTTAVLTLQTVSGDNSLTDRYFVRGVTSAGTRLFSIDTAGNLRATTKSFDIPHPTKEGARLVYGVLEGPEHGVYHRGTVEGTGVIQVNLPDYWHKLVGDQYTIQLTPWGNYNVCINSKTVNYFTIQLVGDFISRKFKNIKVDYIVHGSRLDAPLDTEQ
jgi:hypothetical protein